MERLNFDTVLLILNLFLHLQLMNLNIKKFTTFKIIFIPLFIYKYDIILLVENTSIIIELI